MNTKYKNLILIYSFLDELKGGTDSHEWDHEKQSLNMFFYGVWK